MGADIWMFIEHKNHVTNKWNLVKNSKWNHNMVPLDRNNGLFHILCGYNKNDFNELSVIYTEIIPFMLSVDTNCQNVRIVFGLSL